MVEDESSVQGTVCTFLRNHGFRTLQAETVATALKTLGSKHVDAVILDLRLPDPQGLELSGLELLGYLRCMPEYDAVPVLIFTGKTLTEHDEDLIRRYGAYVLYKPAAYSSLVEYLQRLTARGMILDDLDDPRR